VGQRLRPGAAASTSSQKAAANQMVPLEDSHPRLGPEPVSIPKKEVQRLPAGAVRIGAIWDPGRQVPVGLHLCADLQPHVIASTALFQTGTPRG
jgi:hypothetical protein